MKKPFFDTFKNVRLNRILSLLGEEWFNKKTVLELGACYGDIGKELINLGAQLSFSDIRPEHLNSLSKNFPSCNIYEIDQNSYYNLNKKFDLVLHLGVSYHLVNWEEDLKNALQHTNCLIFETALFPYSPLENPNEIQYFDELDPSLYISYNKQFRRTNEQGLIECFNKLNVKYLRIDTPQMTTPYILDVEGQYLRFLYGWEEKSIPKNINYIENNTQYITSARQMYLLLK